MRGIYRERNAIYVQLSSRQNQITEGSALVIFENVDSICLRTFPRREFGLLLEVLLPFAT